MRAAVNVLDTLAIENAVSEVTGVPAATSARPASPRQTDPSANTIATEIPGIPERARRCSRRASRVAVRSAVALGARGAGRITGSMGAGVTGPGSGVGPAGGPLAALDGEAVGTTAAAGSAGATTRGARPSHPPMMTATSAMAMIGLRRAALTGTRRET